MEDQVQALLEKYNWEEFGKKSEYIKKSGLKYRNFRCNLCWNNTARGCYGFMSRQLGKDLIHSLEIEFSNHYTDDHVSAHDRSKRKGIS